MDKLILKFDSYTFPAANVKRVSTNENKIAFLLTDPVTPKVGSSTFSVEIELAPEYVKMWAEWFASKGVEVKW